MTLGSNRGFAAVLALLGLSVSAHADVGMYWSRVAADTIRSAETVPASASRNLGNVHIALFEAMNFVEGRYRARLLITPTKPAGMSADVVGAAAAHRVLAELYPSHQVALDKALTQFLAATGRTDDSAALITGSSLGMIVKVGRTTDLSPALIEISVVESTSWAEPVTAYVIQSGSRALENARLYALAALAADEVYRSARGILSEYGIHHPCIPCTIHQAVVEIVASTTSVVRTRPISASAALAIRLGTTTDGVEIGRQVLGEYAAVAR
jgi:hypothetical protein